MCWVKVLASGRLRDGGREGRREGYLLKERKEERFFLNGDTGIGGEREGLEV